MHFFRRRAVVPQSNNLSADFASELMELEGQVTINCTKDAVKRLMELYSAAIEHYALVGDPLSKHFQEKLRTLLRQTQVVDPVEAPARREGLYETRTVEKAIRVHYEETQLGSEMLRENVQSQDKGLHLRVRQRQKKPSVHFTELQAEMEQVLEWYLEEKHRITAEIKEKYQGQAQELVTDGTDSLMAKVVDKIQKDMHTHLQSALDELHAKKQQALETVRAKYL